MLPDPLSGMPSRKVGIIVAMRSYTGSNETVAHPGYPKSQIAIQIFHLAGSVVVDKSKRDTETRGDAGTKLQRTIGCRLSAPIPVGIANAIESPGSYRSAKFIRVCVVTCGGGHHLLQ